MKGNPQGTRQLIRTAGISIGRTSLNTANAITGALWYNVFATNDAVATLGGSPYSNIGRMYRGSFNDVSLNAQVPRFAESPAAMAQILNYRTTGLLDSPLFTLHTFADPILPFWHEALYAAKAQATSSSSALTEITAMTYGHCNVSASDAEAAVLALLLKAGP